jgi:hypothetical protein
VDSAGCRRRQNLVPETENRRRRSARSVAASFATHGEPRWPELATAFVVLLLAGISLVLTHRQGGIPQADDWSYVKSALTLDQHRHLALQGWGQMFLLGQLLTAQPFLWLLGAHPFSLEVYGAATTALWLGCAFVIGRRCLGPRRAFLLVLALAVWPGMGVLTSSFMTDTPAAGSSLLCVILGIGSIERRSRLRLAGAMLTGLLAFTIREQFVVALVAVATGAVVARGVPRRFRLEAVGGTVGVLIVGALLEHFRHQMANADRAPFSFSTLQFNHVPSSLVPCLFTVALAVAPLACWTLLTLRRKDLLDPGRLTGWLLGLAALGYVAQWNFATVPTVTLRNYVLPTGSFGGVAVGYAPPIMGVAVWHALQITAMISAIVLTGEIGARLRRLNALWNACRAGSPTLIVLTVYWLLLGAFVVGLAFGGQVQFDRYLLPLFPGAGILLLRPSNHHTLSAKAKASRTPIAVATVLMIAFLAAVELNMTVSTDARDGTIWRAATRLTQLGVPAEMINAGLDWNGYYASTPTNRPDAALDINTYAGQHWTHIFPRASDCFVVTLTRVPARYRHWHLIAITRARPYGFHLTRITVYSYFRTSCSPSQPHIAP